MNFLLIGILLGMGAAIPIGPVNLEIIRRNLHFGTPYGIALGLGACGADVTYLVLLCLGFLSLVADPLILKLVGLGGSMILIWFAIASFRAKPVVQQGNTPRPSLIRYTMEGYIITLFNPITILFWASISSQISLATLHHTLSTLLFSGLGVIIGTVGWVLFLNTLLHFTRHRLNARVMRLLNYIGGVILLGFAIAGLIKVFVL